jgi:hypothetical protein
LPQPPSYKGYYRNIAVLAFPSPEGTGISTRTDVLTVTTSVAGVDARFLAAGDGTKTFHSDTPCLVQYAFDQPFTCRSITIHPGGNNYQANRLLIEVSDDGEHFRSLGRLVPPRNGWQDGDADVTHAIMPTTARFFRFVYDPAGSEPGAEDLDYAKWKPEFRVKGIEFSSAPRINQFEGKSGAVWRVSRRTTTAEVPDAAFVPLNHIVDLTSELTADSHLHWDVPEGHWTILRMGHTSTGYENDTGGGGRGLECDKFNPEAARVQFDHWFGAAIREVGPELAGRVLKVFHVDSWECGSQNWSPVFREEFKRRRGGSAHRA